MKRKPASVIVLLAAAMLAPPLLTASAATPVVIHNPWLVNDRVADTHNLVTMGATYINDYTTNPMTPPANNQAKAINIYNNQKRRLYHWADEPPSVGGNDINDPTYNQNVFGWGLCGRHACQACTIAKQAGLGQRKISVPGDWQYELIYDGGNHLFHTMMTFYVFTRGSTPHIASCDEIKADNTLVLNAVAEGRACPGFLLCGDTADGEVSMVNSYSDGGDASVTTRWTGNMDLHSGQVFKRTWESWLNQHPTPNTDADSIAGVKDAPFHHEANKDYKDTVNIPYWEPYTLTSAANTALNIGHPISYRRWANGTDTLTPDFRSAAYQALLYSSTGIATYNDDSLTPDLHAATVGTTAEAVFQINVPYYITDANFSGDFVKTNSGDVCNVQVSSNGTSWTTVWTASALGTTHVANQSLRANVFTLWTTWYIKVQCKGTVAKSDAGVSNFVVVTTFEHNKGAMAYLDRGVNNVTLTFDNPAELVASGNVLKVTYKWKEYSGADWTVDKTYVRYVSASPTVLTITTGGTKVPRTEYIQMEVVPTPAPDVTAPAAVADLRSGGAAGRTSVPLAWTAPGNDGSIGEATGYDLRYSTSPIDDSNFSSALPVANIPVPRPAGGAESFTVTGLTPSTTYYFAIKAFDNDGNTAAISNIATITTMAVDTQAPNAISNLAAAAATTPLGRYNLTWTAPSDNGNGYVAAYDLRWSTSVITAANFSSATPITGLSAPKTAGGAESFAANGLPTGVTVYFAIEAVDDSGNASAISNVPSAKGTIGTVTFQNGLNGYSGCQDTYIDASAVTAKYEGTTYLQIAGMGGGTNRKRVVVKFDLSSLPTAAVITKATLYLYAYSNEQHDANGGIYAAYHVFTPWSASAVSWNMPWVQYGGADIDTLDGQTPKQTTTGVWYAIDVTTRAQRYISGQDGNNGWVIKTLNDTYLNQDWFYASEEPTNTTLRPKLVVTDDPLVADHVAPPAVSDLAVSVASSTSITLTWTSPVDYADGGAGPFACASYNLRYSTNPITNDATFAAATAVATAAPGTPGTAQTKVVTGLQSNRTYSFAIKSTDGGGNFSPLSNTASGTTLSADSTPPNWIGNLKATPSKTGGGVDLTWTAPADYGANGAGPFTCASYTVRRSTSPILYSDGDATWNAATNVTGAPTPHTPGTAETFTVSGLTAGTTYYFAIKAGDDAIPTNTSQVSNCASSKPSVLGEKTLQVGLNSYTGQTDAYFSPGATYPSIERMVVTGYADQGAGNVQRGVTRFDLSSIPAGTTLSSATLSLYSYYPSQTNGSAGYYCVYPVTTDWLYNQVSWTVAKTGINWVTAGGDYGATADATAAKKAAAAIPAWYNWNVTARVQSWLSNPSTNYGWIIRCDDENRHNQDYFYQVETANTTLRPKLVLSDVLSLVPGDVNGDRAVDVLDLLEMATAWGTTCGVNRLYDPRCDLNSDGSVDVIDLLTLADNWP